jgi:hypothetical protein
MLDWRIISIVRAYPIPLPDSKDSIVTTTKAKPKAYKLAVAILPLYILQYYDLYNSSSFFSVLEQYTVSAPLMKCF